LSVLLAIAQSDLVLLGMKVKRPVKWA